MLTPVEAIPGTPLLKVRDAALAAAAPANKNDGRFMLWILKRRLGARQRQLLRLITVIVVAGSRDRCRGAGHERLARVPALAVRSCRSRVL